MLKTLIFDITGDLAHFRKNYTTSSPLSYAVITPTAVCGVIGAILGLNKEHNQYIRILQAARTKISIALINPVRKLRVGINLINTKSNIWVPKQRQDGARTQIKFEYLKEPAFRIYITMQNDDLFSKLIEYVRSHQCVYTVSLGLSELLADFTYVDLTSYQLCKSDSSVWINSLLPVNYICEKGLNLESGSQYFKERLPCVMNENRVVKRYDEVLFDARGRAVSAQVNSYYSSSTRSDHIIWLT